MILLTAALFPVLVLAEAVEMTPAMENTSGQSVRQYTIASGSLDSVLNQFAVAAGIELSVSGKLTAGKKSDGLQGSYSVIDGLNTILSGTGYQVQNAAENNYVITAPDQSGEAVTLAPVMVSTQRLGDITEGTHSYTSGAVSSATKFSMTPRETPQTVSVVTEQLIEDFALRDMEDVMAMVPGIVVSTADNDRRNYISRGYPMAVQYDGMPSASGIDGGVSVGPDSAVIDHTEVLMGASGLMNGAGQPGGTINIVRKRPTAEAQASVEASVGSWNSRRISGDLSGSLNKDNSVRGRLVSVEGSEDSFRDYLGLKKKVAYGIIEGDLTDSTVVSAAIQVQDIYDNVTDRNGLPTDSDGNELGWERSTVLAPIWNNWDKYSTTYTLRLDQQLSESWLMSAQITKMKAEANWLFGTFNNFDSVSGDATFTRWAQTTEETNNSYELFVKGSVEWFGREHELLVGGNRAEWEWDSLSGDGADMVANLYLFDPVSTLPRPEISITDRAVQSTDQYGGFVAGRFSITDALTTILGARSSWYEYSYVTSSSPDPTEYGEDGVITPYAGLVYDVNEWASAYLSYTDIFNPQSSKSPVGKTLDPEIGSNYELGIKGEFYDGALNASLALFQIEKENEANQIDSIPYDPGNICGGYCYAASGKTVTKGFDLNVAGELEAGWQILGGYTQYRKDDFDGIVRIFKTSTSYTLPNEKWVVGGSVDIRSKSYGQWDVTEEARNLLGLFVKYYINPHLDVALNGTNLLDEKYFANDGTGYGNQYYGEPRAWTLVLRGEW